MRGSILGAVGSVTGGTILPRGAGAPAPVWSIAGTTQIVEGDNGTYTVSYTGATLAPGQQATITVATATDGLTWPDATAGSDYTALSTVLTFTGGGVTEKTVAVSTIDDSNIEGTEDFRVTLGGPSVGTLVASQANTVIVSEDSDNKLLDLLTGTAVQAYSMRKLRAAYAGSCVRLRRSSDNAENDFGFDGSGNLDTAAIASWLGGANGFVVTWYDQSGNGSNAMQGTAAAQPVYLASHINARPVLDFVPNDLLTMSRPAPASTWTTLAVVQKDSTADGFAITDNTQNRQHRINRAGGGNNSLYAGTELIKAYAGDTTQPHLYEWENRGSSMGELWVDATSLGTGDPGTGTLGCDQIGALTAGSSWIDGKIAEVVVFNPNLSGADRAIAEANIADYWGTP